MVFYTTPSFQPPEPDGWDPEGPAWPTLTEPGCIVDGVVTAFTPIPGATAEYDVETDTFKVCAPDGTPAQPGWTVTP